MLSNTHAHAHTYLHTYIRTYIHTCKGTVHDNTLRYITSNHPSIHTNIHCFAIAHEQVRQGTVLSERLCLHQAHLPECNNWRFHCTLVHNAFSCALPRRSIARIETIQTYIQPCMQCMYDVGKCMCMCIHIYICMYVSIYMCMCIHVYVCMYVRMYVCACTCLYVYVLYP